MFSETINSFSNAAIKKNNLLKQSFVGYFALSMLAAIYVGFAVVLIISIGAPLFAAQSMWLKSLIGAAFAVALTLVVFAGAELFTSNNMIMTIGALDRKISCLKALKLWLVCYLGNLAGGVLLAVVVDAAGLISKANFEFTAYLATYKVSAPFFKLFLKGVLCNVLVCLAIWSCQRTKSDAAKLGIIFWCLFAFVSSGFEHSIANMSLLSLGVISTGRITLLQLVHNLLPVSLGNLAGGALVGAAYFFIAKRAD